MLEFVRAAVMSKDPDIHKVAVVDWDKLMDLSAMHGLLGWVWDGICKLPMDYQPPRQQRINWGISVQAIRDVYGHQKSVLRDIVEVYGQNSVRLLLLKGIGLSELYPNPPSRPSGDIDFYLFGDYPKGNKILTEGDYDETEKRAGFDYKGVHIENHKLFLTPNSILNKNVNIFLVDNCYKSKLTPMGYFVFEPISELIFQTMHIVAHVNDLNNGITFKMFVDFGVTMGYYSQSIVPEQLKKTLIQLSMLRLFCLFLYASEEILNVKYDDFHWVDIPLKNVSAVLRLVLIHEVEIDDIGSKPLVDKLHYYFKRSILMNRLYKYLPQSRWHSYWTVIRMETSLIIRSIKNIA